MDQKKPNHKKKYTLSISALAVVALVLSISLMPGGVTTTVSAATTPPLDPVRQILAIELLGIQDVDGNRVRYFLPEFDETYTVRNDRTLTGVQIVVTVNTIDNIDDYGMSFKLKAPNGQYVVDVPRTSSDWQKEWADDSHSEIIFTLPLNVSLSQTGNWIMETSLWYYH